MLLAELRGGGNYSIDWSGMAVGRKGLMMGCRKDNWLVRSKIYGVGNDMHWVGFERQA